jgi:hypothetical protein
MLFTAPCVILNICLLQCFVSFLVMVTFAEGLSNFLALFILQEMQFTEKRLEMLKVH